jgi:hypothetical protein
MFLMVYEGHPEKGKDRHSVIRWGRQPRSSRTLKQNPGAENKRSNACVTVR